MAADAPETTAEPAKSHAPGTLLGGKFRIGRLLGEGGMGAVYEVTHEVTHHQRALKLLHAEVQRFPGIVARFLREASAAGRVGNAHIIETFDGGTLDSGEPYLVMELLRGEPLRNLIDRKRLGLGEMADLVGQACEGVQAAHDAGIVHRDLKPENLFVIDQGGRPFVKILDFGVSKFDLGQPDELVLTVAGSMIGTPYYMSPEQVRGEPNLDARADVYALGVILYECATGQRPFDAPTLPHLSVLIHQGVYTPLSSLRPDLPASFGRLVARAMALEPAQRFPTPRDLGAALGDCAASGAGAPRAEASSALRLSMPPLQATPLDQSTAGVESSVVGSRRPRLPVLIGGVAIASLALASFALYLQPAGGPPTVALRVKPLPHAPVIPDTPSAPAVSVTPSALVVPVDAPALASSPVPVPLPSPPASAHRLPPVVALRAPVSPPATTTTPPAQPTTRADQKGLVQDNPFHP